MTPYPKIELHVHLEATIQPETLIVGEPMVPPRTPSFDTTGQCHGRSGESAVSPPRAEGQ